MGYLPEAVGAAGADSPEKLKVIAGLNASDKVTKIEVGANGLETHDAEVDDAVDEVKAAIQALQDGAETLQDIIDKNETIRALLATIDADTGTLAAAVGTGGTDDPTEHMSIGVRYNDGAPDEGTDTKIGVLNADMFGALLSAAHDYSSRAIDIQQRNASPWPDSDAELTALTAPAQETAPQNVEQNSRNGFEITVASIDTNIVVEIRSENDAICPLANTAVPSTSISSNQMTITANGNYILWTEAPVDQIKLYFVSEDGGTAATITPTFRSRRM